MKSRHFVAVTALAMVLAAPAWADLEKAKELLSQGDGEAAVEELETLAYGGNAEAMVFLGDIYHAGDGVRANYSLAWSWYNRASRQNDAEAQYKLGRMMLLGEGAPQNELNALELFERAAESGHEMAQLEAGLIYRDGRRQIRKSTSKAVEYLTAAASQGNVEAELALEDLHEQGEMPRQDVFDSHSDQDVRAETALEDRDEQGEGLSTEVAEPRSEQDVRAMSEPDRIRAAILAWIESVNARFEGPGSGHVPEVNVTEVDGVFEVRIPDMVITTGMADSIRFGLVEISLTPIGEASEEAGEDWMMARRYRIDMTPPNRIELQDGGDVYTVTYESSDITGVWLPALYNFVESDLRLRNIEVADPTGYIVAKAERGDWVVNLQESEPGIWSGPYGMEVTNVVITPPEGGTVTLGRFSTETAVNGVKVEPYGRIVNQLNTDPEAFVSTLVDPSTGGTAISEMIDLIASSSFDMAIEDLSYAGPQGNQAFALARLGFGGGASQDGNDNGRLTLSYEHAGLVAPFEGPEAALVPQSTHLAFNVERIPMESLARGVLELLGMAMVEAARAEPNAAMPDDFSEAELQARFLNIVSEARTGVTLELAMESALSSIDLTGGIEANAEALFGVSGAFDLTISEIDAVLAMVDQDPMMAAYKDMVMAFAAIAVREPGPNSGENAKFTIDIQPDGNLLVNGQNAFAVFGAGMAPPPETQEN